MDKSLLIAVFVPTTDEAGTDFEGKRGELATGYPVARDLILTARHVLQPEPPHWRDRRYLVKIRWHYFRPNNDSGWIEVPERNIVWPSQGALDVALIRCSRPSDAVGWGIVSCDQPRDGMEWASEGFPRATKYENQRHPSSFIGKVCSKAPAEPYFELTAETAPADEEDWQGVSGMPVFVGHKIFGVVQSVPPNFNARKLYATPAWQLLKDEKIRQAIGYDEQVKRVKRIKGELIRTLAPAAGAIDALVDKLEMADDMPGLDAEKRTESLADRLLEMDVRKVMKVLRRTHHALCEERSQSGESVTNAAASLAKAAQLIVPAIYDYGVVKWTGSQQNVALVPLPAGIKTVAEIIMAGVDGRETRFRHREYEDDQPEGELSLPRAPECGIDPGGVQARAALQEHLSRKFSPEETETTRFRRVVDDYLLATYTQAESGGPERSREQRIRRTASLLWRKREDSGQTFYMLFYLPEDVGEQYALRALVQSLKDDYPAIMFLGLDSDFEQEQQDRELVDPLCRMLPIKQTARSDVVSVPDDAHRSPPSVHAPANSVTPARSDDHREPSSQTKIPGSEIDRPPAAPPESSTAMSAHRFRIALSFPGEYREFVAQVAARLATAVGGDRVLYDRYYEAEFARPDLDTYLQHLYHDESELIAVFLCADYERKEWCGLEWRAVRDLIKQRQASTVMPFRFDNTAIPGLFSTDGYVWIGDRPPQEIANLILQRMGINAGHTAPTQPSWKEKLGRWVKKIRG